MGGNRYSEKEIAIFDGLVELIRNGANPYSIKVSDIAEASNVGKGTIYDYFKSKEEAISKAILYSVNKEIEYACAKIRSKNGFKEKFYEILHIMVECLKNQKPILNVLLSAGGLKEFYEYLADEECVFSDIIKTIDDIIEHVLQEGTEEGLIDSLESNYYKKMVVRGAIAGFSGYINHKNWYINTSLDEAMDSSYKLLLKALK